MIFISYVGGTTRMTAILKGRFLSRIVAAITCTVLLHPLPTTNTVIASVSYPPPLLNSQYAQYVGKLPPNNQYGHFVGLVTVDPPTIDPLTIYPLKIDPLQLNPFNQLLYLLGSNVLFSILFVTIDPKMR